MKQKLMWIVLALATAAQATTPDTVGSFPLALKPVVQEARAAYLAAGLLSRYHYQAVPLDDALSSKVFDQYLKALDPQKLYFMQGEIDRLSVDRTLLDDAIRNQDLSLPFEIFNLYVRRAAQRLAYARSLLQEGFNFQREESYQIDRKNQAWPAAEAQVQDIWRQRVKDDWLRLKLAGKDDPSIIKILDKRYDNVLKRLNRITSQDAFQTFMNAYTTAIEPHTNYMGPRAAEDFGIAMRLSLVGIGAVLTERDEYTTIRELVPGGPASVSGKLKIGDRIVGVAQGDVGAMEDVLGARLDDTVALIRGTADSTVRLDILPAEAGPDGAHKIVTLVRKTISMQDQAAKAKVYSVTEGTTMRRVGVITLPSFYEDFKARQLGGENYRSVSHDVTRLLGDLKKQKVDSVLVDLRNNGGGSLRQAIELTGLFVGKVPVVQERHANGEIKVETNTRTGIAWNGPLGVLINRASASASEIFAAAIQDYGRGLIMGDVSFGKGTVQTIASLDQIAKNAEPAYGELKMTIAQFFRVTGGTTQLRGVTPDIAFPGAVDAADFGESSYDNALPWINIKAANYAPVDDLTDQIPILLALHQNRIRHDKGFQYLREDILRVQQLRKKNVISLNEADRRSERSAQEKRLSAREDGARKGVVWAAGGALQDDGLQVDERNLVKELAAENKKKSARDVLLNEAVSILGDQVALQKPQFKLATHIPSKSPVMVMELVPQN
ncbi:MAG: carboxy terminal-processing peptidase [Polaromonas sp.]|nr:carboxy terminal-processing peptidase [Polaromonas sp.]